MFSDPQFWVAVSFFLFIAAIFNPVRKILTSSLDNQINEIKNKIEEAEDIKNQAEHTLSELKVRENEVTKEIEILRIDSEKKISEIKKLSSDKLSNQINKRKMLGENKIDQIIRDTNLSIQNHITNVAIQATTDILQNNLTKDKKSDLIGESVKELNNILKN